MLPPDQPLRVADTNSAEEFSGSVLGIQVPLFRWVIGALVAGLALFVWLESNTNLSTTNTLLLALAPAVLCGLFVAFFVQGKPTGYARDLFESLTTHGDASSLANHRSAPLITSFPDGYLCDGLIVFGSPNQGGRVAKGFWIEVFSLHHASNAERNAFQERIRQLLRLLPKGFTMQVQWWVDSDYRSPLRRYQQDTQKSNHPLATRLRNLNFLWHWKRMPQLRRERVAVFIGRELQSPSTPWTSPAAEMHHDAHLDQLRVELSELGRQMAALFNAQGGRVLPM